MLLTDAGKLIRIHVSGIRIAGRNTQGVTLFKINRDLDERDLDEIQRRQNEIQRRQGDMPE